MRIQVEKDIKNIEIFNKDVYVADYTNQTDSQRKLEFHIQKPSDINSFCLQNRQRIEIYGVNFEKNPSFAKGHKMCECMFTPVHSNKTPWLLLLEMKYCQKEDNVDEDSSEAIIQLRESFNYLTERFCIQSNEYRFYLVISMPDYSNKEPFTNFRETQSDILENFSKNRIKILGYNKVLVATPNYLFPVKQVVRV